VVGTGSGTLVVSPADAVSGTPVSAAPAANAVNVPIAASTAQVVGEPRLTLTYSGTGTVGHVFAQIVDEQRNVVLGNQVTPVPVTLDGASHAVTRPLEGVAASMAAGGRYRLQVIGGSQVYGPVRGAGAITLSAVRVELPTVGAAAARCRSDRRFAIRLPRRMRSAKVFVAGKRTKVRRRHGRLRSVVDVRRSAKRRVTVRIVGRTRGGKLVRQKRVYRFC
jgi:ABC-2 type transport system ATP-binding protein